MKTFIIKSFYVLIAGLFGYGLALFALPEFKKASSEIPVNYNTNKLDSCRIIVCGDSRADRQIDPAIIHQATGLNTINIATSSWDLYALSKAFNEIKLSNKILIISASFFQINDGAIDDGYFSDQAFADLSLREKLSLYRYRPIQLFNIQSNLFARRLKSNTEVDSIGNDKRIVNLDYNKKDPRAFILDEAWMERHPWYRSPNINGIKKELLMKAFFNLSLLKNCTLVIYNGPVCPGFIKLGKKTGAVQLEESYDAFMSAQCSRYKNMFYHSFLMDSSFENKDFLDPQHLCGSGASKFTHQVVDLLRSYQIVKQ
jgi:hypothetical protein